MYIYIYVYTYTYTHTHVVVLPPVSIELRPGRSAEGPCGGARVGGHRGGRGIVAACARA